MFPTEINYHLKAFYGDDVINKSTVNQWVIQFQGCKSGNAVKDHEKQSRHLITATDDEHLKLINDLIQYNWRITQKYIANSIGISKECVGSITEQMGYCKICA